MQRQEEVISSPIVELDHDHDDLAVVLQDLQTLVGEALGEETRTSSLSRACQLLRYFQEDMRAHFQREEDTLFPTLREVLPEREAAIASLARAHENFRQLVSGIDDVLHASQVTNEDLEQTVKQLQRLTDLFKGHSNIECELLRVMDTRVTDPAKRAELQERLSEV